MLLLGDLACPDLSSTHWLEKSISNSKDVYFGKNIICNFEGLIFSGEKISANRPLLYNHPSVVGLLLQYGQPVFCLANNHILDLPDQFDVTLNYLNTGKIPFAGIGRSRVEAAEPIKFNEGNTEIVLFNSCWDFLLYNTKNPNNGVFVAEINELNLIKEIQKYKKQYPSASIVVYLHWNFDLEILPFPSYRQFSMALIDAGAGLVVGSHSHCVQGGEKYKNGFIIYGLGNFFIPHNQFIKGKLIYPEFSSVELALEWDPLTNIATCHWFRYVNVGDVHSLIRLESETFEKSERLKQYSPFAGMNEEIYLDYFRKNRRKRMLIPIFKDYRSRGINSLYTYLLKIRVRNARLLAGLNLINWQN